MKPLLSKPEIQRLITELKVELRNAVEDLQKCEELRVASLPPSSAEMPITWPDLTAHVNALKMRVSDLRLDLDYLEKAERERRPAIVRVALNDLGLDDLPWERCSQSP